MSDLMISLAIKSQSKIIFFADIEVQFTGTEDIASEVSHKESQSTPEVDVINITATSEEPFQKRQSRSSLAHPENKILGKKEDPI